MHCYIVYSYFLELKIGTTQSNLKYHVKPSMECDTNTTLRVDETFSMMAHILRLASGSIPS